MRKIIILIAFFTVLLSLLFYSKVFADQWSPTEDWGEQVGTYSPDWGRTVMYEYNDSEYNLYVSPQARFRFTQDAINSIRNYYLNFSPTLYYTFDISVSDQYNTTVSALNTTMYYSTLPSPHFDRDDDPEPWGNGYYDETEVICLSPLSMLANTDYRFDSRFKVYYKSTIMFEFASQMSYYTLGEYDTYYYDIHKTRTYPWY